MTRKEIHIPPITDLIARYIDATNPEKNSPDGIQEATGVLHAEIDERTRALNPNITQKDLDTMGQNTVESLQDMITPPDTSQN